MNKLNLFKKLSLMGGLSLLSVTALSGYSAFSMMKGNGGKPPVAPKPVSTKGISGSSGSGLGNQMRRLSLSDGDMGRKLQRILGDVNGGTKSGMLVNSKSIGDLTEGATGRDPLKKAQNLGVKLVGLASTPGKVTVKAPKGKTPPVPPKRVSSLPQNNDKDK